MGSPSSLNYLNEDGDPIPCLFFPHNVDNLNRFMGYCNDVDLALRTHSQSAPPYAREYFMYYTIWQMRGWRFPVPLGTASVVGALEKMTTKLSRGFSEVIAWIASCVSWAPRLKSKVFISHDQFDTMLQAISDDPLIAKPDSETHQETRRKASRRKASPFSLRLSHPHPHSLSFQMFTIFFSHLTTYITETDIYLRTHPPSRERLPTKDLSEFRRFYDDAHASILIMKSKNKSADLARSTDKGRGKGKGKATNDDDDDVYYKDLADAANQKALAGLIEQNPSRKKNSVESFVAEHDWSLVKYAFEWRRNASLMSHKPFNRKQRTAIRIGERLLVMSGLSWNIKSQNKGRDWTTIIAAVTIETAIIESYRRHLLAACPGACALRDVIHKYLRGISNPHYVQNPVSGNIVKVIDWSFPDGIPLDVPTAPPRSYDPDSLRKELEGVEEGNAAANDQRDPVLYTINALRKNRLLWSSDPDAPHGSLETLAHRCLEALSHVRLRLPLSPSLYLSRHLSSLLHPRSCISTTHASITPGRSLEGPPSLSTLRTPPSHPSIPPHSTSSPKTLPLL